MGRIAEPPVREEDLQKYVNGWAREMAVYWRERMEKLMCLDTGHLYNSIRDTVHPGPVTTIEHNFMRYGIYVSAGVSPGFAWKLWGHNAKKQGKVARPRAGNGQLEILDPSYRSEHGLSDKKNVGPKWGGRLAGGQPKGRRDWYSRKYYSSVMRLNEFAASFYGAQYQGLISTGLGEIFSHEGVARWL